jgi:hypothetical protein
MSLTPSQLTLLQTELLLPAYADLVAAGADNALADLLNTRDIATTRLVPVDEIQAWMMGNGVWFALRMAQRTEGVPDLILAAIEFVVDACASRLAALDLGNAQCQQLIGAFQQATLLTAEQAAELAALGESLTTRALQVVGQAVTTDDVSAALKAVREEAT